MNILRGMVLTFLLLASGCSLITFDEDCKSKDESNRECKTQVKIITGNNCKTEGSLKGGGRVKIECKWRF